MIASCRSLLHPRYMIGFSQKQPTSLQKIPFRKTCSIENVRKRFMNNSDEIIRCTLIDYIMVSPAIWRGLS